MRPALFLLPALLLAGCSAPAPPRACDAPPLGGALPARGPEEVAFATPDGVVLHGLLWTGSPQHGVVLVHGLNEDQGRWLGTVEELAARGATVLTFDLRGHGRSTMRGNETYELANFTAEDFLRMDMDAAAAVEVLRGRGVAPCLAVGGASIGANLALRVAAAKPLVVSTVALLSPGADYHGVALAEAAKAYPERPLLIAYGRGDAYAAQSGAELAQRMGGRAARVVLESPAHGTNLLAEPGFQDQIVAWLLATA